MMNLMAHTDRHRWGFTLIELLVVISIIALLISILLPALGAARAAARQAVCLGNIRQLGIGMYTYAGDYDEAIPFGAFQAAGGTHGNPLGTNGTVTWDDLVAPYVGSGGMTHAVAWYDELHASRPGAEAAYAEVLVCPSDEADRPGTALPRSYLINRGAARGALPLGYRFAGIAGVFSTLGNELAGQDDTADFLPNTVRLSQVDIPSDTLSLGEGHHDTNVAGGAYGGSSIMNNFTWSVVRARGGNGLPTQAVAVLPHGSQAGEVGDAVNTVNPVLNYAYVDGHAATSDAWATLKSPPSTWSAYYPTGGQWERDARFK